MPINTYLPQWDEMKKFHAKFSPLIPSDYSGWIGIRLHRTGFPLTLEIFGPELPEHPLYPMVLLKCENGELNPDWDQAEMDFDVPWIKEADFHAYRDDVMTFYHAEDHLEPASEEVMNADSPSEELLRKAFVVHDLATA